MLELKEVEPEMTYPLRHKILRPHQSFEECIYDTDYKPGAFHIGAFYQKKLISVASFCAEKCPDFSTDKQFRLRAMATLTEFRNMGAGRFVVSYAEDVLKDQDVKFLWCKGRTNVQVYYEKIGFTQYGEVFEYPSIGPHVVMYKSLI
ncbi:GNAT family N-acetyltransferase [Virgibacillus sp. DJP39]|uniref:GNAT family N-acetyltransferase n=1 Tax=Virgibacillus sp. DJP39 TaxID=3409790 RepID=UPI003BB5F8F3